MPESNHKDRDLAAFLRIIREGERLDKRLHGLYARELFIAGEDQDFLDAGFFFEESCRDTARDAEEIKEAACAAARAARIAGDTGKFFKYAMKVVACEGCAEICCELGDYYLREQDIDEAVVWYYNAAYETESILNLSCSGEIPLYGLAECYRAAGNEAQAAEYERLARDAAARNHTAG